jgi:peptidyl-prolyl cis-trans isomerase C
MRAVFLVLLASLAGCQPEVPAPIPGALPAGGTEIGKAGELVITQEMIDTVEVRIPPDQLERIKATGRYQEFRERIALGQVLYERAVAAGMHEQPDVQIALAMSARDVLAAELLDKVGQDAITEESIKEAYEARKVQFARPSVHARQIVVRELTLAEDLKKQLDGGADFAELAKAHSIDVGTKEEGGDLGWFEKERYFAEVTEPAFAAEPGMVLGPIETRLGYHLVKVEEKRESTPIEEVRPMLEQAIKDEAIEAYVDEVEKSTAITWTDGGEGEAPATAGGEHAGHGHP